ncbi:VC0807 family protein [Actinoallomurus sp. CA-142502]|uniref:VC0807 family protein n=1 Tax=Actinoallomurus sp. CA-142502 TaxID=3239885 RepID=UPI003D944ABD
MGQRRRRHGARLVRLALDLGISPLAYYGGVLAGVSTLRSLLTATVVAGVWLVAVTVHDRKADALAVCMLGMYGVMAALAAATADPRLLLTRDPVTSGLAGLVFLGSCVKGTPATAYLARKLHGERPADERAHRRLHLVETVVLGIGLTAEALLRLVLVFTLPLSTSATVVPPVEFAVLLPLVGWAVWHRRRARAADGGARAASDPRAPVGAAADGPGWTR